MTDTYVDAPAVRVFADRARMGRAAATDVAAELRRRLAGQDEVRMLFAAAPSQRDLLDALAAEPDIDWRRITAFHLDEYIGLDPAAPQRFGNWLKEAIFDRVPLGRVHLMEPGSGTDTATRMAEGYARLLRPAPIDIVCLGIGVNGHLAFNDPPVADLTDPHDVKVVELDEVCRQQQVDDGLFATFADVPTHAVTLTIPRLLAVDRMYCVVPGSAKREAVRRALHDDISTACPATALRTHQHCILYLDADSAPPGTESARVPHDG